MQHISKHCRRAFIKEDFEKDYDNGELLWHASSFMGFNSKHVTQRRRLLAIPLSWQIVLPLKFIRINHRLRQGINMNINSTKVEENYSSPVCQWFKAHTRLWPRI